MLHRSVDQNGRLLSNAATRITPVEGSEPRQYCLDLSTPGSRLDETVNVGVLTGTESELKRIQLWSGNKVGNKVIKLVTHSAGDTHSSR